jgi:predicted metal-dependent peptidase
LVYDPEVLDIFGYSQDDITTILLHEYAHIILGHIWKLGGRDKKLCNVAQDYVVNQFLVDAGRKLVQGMLFDTRFKDMAWEDVYDKLLKESDGQGKGKGPGGIPGNIPDNYHGDVEYHDVDLEPGQKLMESKGKFIAKRAAENAERQKAGSVPGWAKELIEAKEEYTNYLAELAKFIFDSAQGRDEFDYSHVNKRAMARGELAMGPYRDSIGPVIAILDCSGSMDNKTLGTALGSVRNLCRTANPEYLAVITCDTEVHDVIKVSDSTKLDSFNLTGRGGTLFQPAFDWIRDQKIRPCCVLYFTDLECFDTPVKPRYPVLWMVPEQYYHHNTPGFGKKLKLKTVK